MPKNLFLKLKKEFPEIKRNVSLKEFTTFKIGGRAKYFLEIKDREKLISALKLAKELKTPFFILGGGSNLLVSDKGFDGLVIKTKNTKYEIKDGLIFCEAGAPLSSLVSMAAKNNLTGLEWAVGIPGTIGGAIYGNAGAFGSSIGEIVKEVEVLKIKNCKFELTKLKNKDCQFSYRGSIFKKNPNLIILSAKLKLKKGEKNKIEEKMKKYLDYRRSTQPLKFPSAGSIFKNFTPHRPALYAKLLKIKKQTRILEGGAGAGPALKVALKEFNKKEIPAAYLIEKCGLKGKRVGSVKISEKHTNFIINLGNGKARDVKKLINLTKKKVKEKFGIELKEEIQYPGF